MTFSLADKTVGGSFLFDGNEMAALMQAYNWSSNPLGSPDTWPQSLRIVIRLILASRYPMFIWWGHDLIQFYNDAFRRTMAPQQHPSALGQCGRECWAKIWDLIEPQIKFVMDGKGATWHEDHLIPVPRDGALQQAWWTYGLSPIEEGDGGIGGVLAICNDVTESHLAAEKLRLQKNTLARKIAELDAVMDAVPAAIFIAEDSLCSTMRANDETYKLLRLPRGANVWKPAPLDQAPKNLITMNDRCQIPTDELPVQLAAREGRIVRDAELDLLFEDGERKTIFGNARPLFSKDGNPHGAVGAFIDITARRKAEAALKEASVRAEMAAQEKNSMLQAVSHDLRQPLEVISLSLSCLANPVANTERRERMIKAGRLGLDRLIQMVDMLDEVGRIESGNIEVNLREINLADLLNRIAAQFETQFENKNLRLKVFCPADVIIQSDLRMISIILQNFIQNGFKYTARGGVLVGTRRRSDKIKIQVFDTGKGIDREKIESTFHPYLRLGDGSEGGLGLGLSIVRKHAARLRHEVQVTSVVGKGTCFSIEVPCCNKILQNVSHSLSHIG